MRGSFPFLLILLSFSTFAQIQVLKTTSPDVPIKSGLYTFENEQLTIVYNFWAERGTFTFVVVNKTSAPIYINWDKSGFDFNGGLLDYRDDVPAANTFGDTLDRSLALSFAWAERLLNKQIGTYSPPTGEVAAIVPGGMLAVGRYRLVELDTYMGDAEYEKYCEGEKNQVKLLRRKYNESNTLFAFGNRLVYSTNSDFANSTTIENHFWVSEIFKVGTVETDMTQTCPYAPHTSYYIRRNTGRY